MRLAKALLMIGSSLNPFTEIWIDAMMVKPSMAAARVYDNFVRNLIDSGVWEIEDVIAGTPTHDEQSSCLNVVNPSSGTDFIKVVNSGVGPVFTPYDGWVCSSGTGWLRTINNINSFANKYTLTNAHIGVYTKTDVGSGDQVDVGCIGWTGDPVVMNTRNGGVRQHKLNFSGTTWAVGGMVTAIGHNVIVKNANLNFSSYQDGVLLGTNTTAGTIGSLSSFPFGMLSNGFGAQSRRKNTIAHCGGTLSALQVDSFKEAVQQFITEAGGL